MCPDLLLFVSFLPIIIHTSVAQGHLWTDKLQDIVLQKLLNQSWRITKKKGVTDVAKQKDIEEIAKTVLFSRLLQIDRVAMVAEKFTKVFEAIRCVSWMLPSHLDVTMDVIGYDMYIFSDFLYLFFQSMLL